MTELSEVLATSVRDKLSQLEVERVRLLPLPQGATQIAQHQAYLKQQAEVVLKHLIQHLRDGTLDWNVAACGLGRITGYYDLLAEIEREKRRLEEQRQQ